ncbi:MAG: DNA primase, partial [Flavobacterium sp.]
FKASLLMDEAKSDPIKKAELIRDMVVSISKIPDRIKREVYIQECSNIMDISEEVLRNTLAQIFQKDIHEAGKKLKQEQKAFEVVKSEPQVATERVSVLPLLELNILSVLVLFGKMETEFTDVFIRFDEEGNEKAVTEKLNCKIFERIYLNLQEDEIHFSNPVFQKVYNELIANFLNDANFEIGNWISALPMEEAAIISDIIMENERYNLHGWLDKKQVFVKEKDDKEVLTSLVTETLISFREYLINKHIDSLIGSVTASEGLSVPEEVLENVNDYNKLKVALTGSIGRMRSVYL